MSNSAPQDAGDAASRAADTDRIQVAQLLAEAAALGRLKMAEYEDRLTKAYAAKTYAELDRLSADLPWAAQTVRRSGECKPAPATVLLAILSGFERRGRWNVPERLTTLALWGNGVIDLRYADFTSTDVEILAYSIMGAQTILLPPEVHVEIQGYRVLGNFDQDVDAQGAPGAPKVTIKGFAVLGGVGIKRKNRRAQS